MNAEYSVEEVRARFEAWVSVRSWFKATIGLDRSDDEYADPCINSRWQGWQAAYAERIKAGEGAVPVAWQSKRRPEDYPDEWRECSKETFDTIKRTKDSPWIVRELFDVTPVAPTEGPGGEVSAADFATAMRNCGLALKTYAKVDQEARRLARTRLTHPAAQAAQGEPSPRCDKPGCNCATWKPEGCAWDDAEPAAQDDGMCNADNPARRCVCREEFGRRVCAPVAQGEPSPRCDKPGCNCAAWLPDGCAWDTAEPAAQGEVAAGLMSSEGDYTVIDCPACGRCVKYSKKDASSKAAYRDLCAEVSALRAENDSLRTLAAQPRAVPVEVSAWVEAKREHKRLVVVYNARVEYAREHELGRVSVDHEYQAMCAQQRAVDALVEPMFKALTAAPSSGEPTPPVWLDAAGVPYGRVSDEQVLAVLHNAVRIVERRSGLGAVEQALAVPDGLVLVPVEPTDAMCDAGDLPDTATAYDIYKAMLAAAPSPGESA